VRTTGVRLALGARPLALWIRMTIETLRHVAIGIGVGVIASLVAVWILAAVLTGVGRPSVPIWAAAIATLGALSAAAVAVPAYRVVRIDPSTALRSE
jgi:ABC-type antimicrobial peptide transport system permease subunit